MNYIFSYGFLVVAILSFFSVQSCSSEKKSDKTTLEQKDDISVLAALPKKVDFPHENPYSDEKAELGKLLFYDPILSGDKDVACATCHHPDFGYAEFLDISIGVNGHGIGSKRDFNHPNDIPFVKRNSQSILNTAFNGISNSDVNKPSDAPMFWDLRAKSLENQSLEPIKALEEMRGRHFEEKEILDEILKRLNQNQTYKNLFLKAFDGINEIKKEHLAKAIATFERTLIANNSRFDQYMRGDKTALSEREKEGLELFLKSGCAKCHNGAMFSDFKVHALGVADNEKLAKPDDGFNEKFQFRTPTLRNLRFTEPYMHNGKIKTLQNVLEFYEDLTGDKIQSTRIKSSQIDPLTQHLQVNFKDIPAIIEFLNSLNDDKFDKTIPQKVPSGLPVGGNLN